MRFRMERKREYTCMLFWPLSEPTCMLWLCAGHNIDRGQRYLILGSFLHGVHTEKLWKPLALIFRYCCLTIKPFRMNILPHRTHWQHITSSTDSSKYMTFNIWQNYNKTFHDQLSRITSCNTVSWICLPH